MGVDLAACRQWGVVVTGAGDPHMVDWGGQLLEEARQPLKVHRVEGGDASSSELEANAVQAIRLARHQDRLRSRLPGPPGRLEANPSAITGRN
ncbi:MAG TPA: hypothetical protein VHR41_05975 [Gemmatimonadales bacterium]|jgi:hypothetical protein|nr:hypothetical protein [Gemmatimonadales bacterium]